MASRVGMEFYGEEGIKTSDSKDYEANEWDNIYTGNQKIYMCGISWININTNK